MSLDDLVKRLRELRVQVGFTRLEPPSASLQGEFDLRTRRAELGQNTTWLPASEVNGEGIFIALSEQAVSDWERLPAVEAREGRSPSASQPAASTRANPAGLTRREMQVLQLLAGNLRNQEIAAQLSRSVRTVDHHVESLFAKLEVTSRSAAIVRSSAPASSAALDY